MKNVLSLGLIFLFVLSVTDLSYAGTEVSPMKRGDKPTKERSRSAASPAFMKGPSEKLGRGIKNFLFGWTEIPKTIVSTTKESNPIIGITAGTLKGLKKAFPKTISGLADVATFPAGNYKKPLIKPAALK